MDLYYCLLLLFLCIGLVFGQYLIITTRFSEHAREYLLMAAKRLRFILSGIFALEFALGSILLRMSVLAHFSGFVTQASSAIFLGVLIALGLVSAERALATAGPQRNFIRECFRLLSRLRLTLLQRFECQVQQLMEEDNLAWQSAEGEWKFDVPPREISRRLRKLYECHKLAIANMHKKKWLMESDIGHFPGRKFYPLVKFLGRKRLHTLLSQPVDAPLTTTEWNGQERRKQNRGPEGRPSKGPVRSYDDQGLMDRITRGEAL